VKNQLYPKFTAPQISLEKIIREIGLETELEYPVGKYSLDIYCPEINKAVEYDGWGHHKNRDEKRDKEILEKFGISIFRIKNLKDEEAIKELKIFLEAIIE
jgi:very-short-patch-repair endonuclease